MYECKRKLCACCPFEYCIDGTEDGRMVLELYMNGQKEKSLEEKRREACRKWYERNKEKERERGRLNYQKRKGKI